MFHLNEVAAFAIMAAVMVFVLFNLERLRRLPFWGLLMSSFLLFLGAGFSSLLEYLAHYDVVEILESIGYAAGSILITLWSLRVNARRRQRD